MGAAARGGRGCEERTRGSGERPAGTACCRHQHNRAPCQPPPPFDRQADYVALDTSRTAWYPASFDGIPLTHTQMAALTLSGPRWSGA